MKIDDMNTSPFDFLRSGLREKIRTTLEQLESIQKTWCDLQNTDTADHLLQLKVGTVLTFAILNRVMQGKHFKDFTPQDWREIAQSVADGAVHVDARRYSEMVFLTYADYIELSAETVGACCTPEMAEQISSLSDELRAQTQMLERGDESEVQYTENCLWISLEAMVKLLSAASSTLMGPELSVFMEGLTAFGFEYGRLMMYQQEQKLITQYIEHQEKLDGELEERYSEYIQQLQDRSREFISLIERAFEPDFGTALKNTAALARSAGVEEKEILKSKEDIDDFFLG